MSLKKDTKLPCFVKPCPRWIGDELPDEVVNSADWLKIVNFFLVHSFCKGQSWRPFEFWDLWKPGPWVPARYLKRPLTRRMFSEEKEEPLHRVNNKGELRHKLDELGLCQEFPGDLNRQVAAYVKVTKGKWNSSVYMSLFFHIRNSLAHGRFALKPDSQGRYVFIFEDGSRVKSEEGGERFELSARGMIRLESLLACIECLEEGPIAQNDLEAQIVGCIKQGLDTKKSIKEELGLSEQGWRDYSRALRKREIIEYDKSVQKWRLSNENS